MQLYFELLKLYNIIPFSEWKKKQPKTNKQKKNSTSLIMLDTNTISARLYCQLSRPKLQLRLFARKWPFGLKLAKKVQPGPERKKKQYFILKKCMHGYYTPSLLFHWEIIKEENFITVF